ncbi:hypothetical protein ACFZDP_29630 [Streptomyces mirabilis]|uniref:hypothetical protein n=1 Tax=Streptomyces mirabilis TaxID=68239 RepID=UPI0006BA955E|nr:hypothetical protein OK006_4765 [Actinobacteria bacterium OK006]
MALCPKPAKGSWTEHYPDLGTGVVSYEDCVSPAFCEVEGEGVFKRAQLNVGQVEDLPRKGSCFTGKLTFVQQESEFFNNAAPLALYGVDAGAGAEIHRVAEPLP